MALIKCKECGKEISDTAKKCPKTQLLLKKHKTNFGDKKNRKIIFQFGMIFCILLIVGFLYYFVFSVPSLETIKDSVVKIESYDDNNNLISTGSGFCAYKNNYIITNFHVIEGASKLKIVLDDNSIHNVINIKIFDYKNDLAILEVDANLKPIKINTSKIKTGQEVIAIGSPKGELNTVSKGIVSNSNNEKGIQISAAISHGSSGGALFNNRHELIGITYAGYDDAQNLNYAISTSYLEKLYEAFNNGNYYKIKASDYDNCMTTEYGFNGCDGIDDNYYSVNFVNDLYQITNLKSLYEKELSFTFNLLFYNFYSDDEKDLVVETYRELLKYDVCLTYTCDIKTKLKSWDTNEFFINLGILDKYKLAFIIVDIQNYNSKESQFNRVESYPIGAAEKSLILYLIGDYSWDDIHKDNKGDIFDLMDSKISNTEDLGSVLELLGYDVRYNNDGTLTAYWN